MLASAKARKRRCDGHSAKLIATTELAAAKLALVNRLNDAVMLVLFPVPDFQLVNALRLFVPVAPAAIGAFDEADSVE